MKRIKIEVAYDGTNYCGWQIQPHQKTVESTLNEVLSKLLKEEIQVIGASRTDSGVHAYANVAVFDTESKIPAKKFSYALNQRLPDDIRIQHSEDVSADFHPRKCNSKKTYLYCIQNRQFELPTNRLHAYFMYRPLDVPLMQEAAAYLVGTWDFKSFCCTRSQKEDTVRTIYELKIEKQEDLIYFKICGNGFLYNMVRIIVGTLIKVGLKVYPPEHVKTILAACDRAKAGPTAPAKGLTLCQIEYESNKPFMLE